MNTTDIRLQQLQLVFFVVVALMLGIHGGMRWWPAEKTFQSLQPLPAYKPLPEFELQDQQAQRQGAQLFRQQWSLVFFGFTSCPDICPLELQKLGKLLRTAEAENISLQVVFISVDPERDSVEKLRAYTAFFHPQIIALRGTNPQLATIALFFGAAYERSAIIDTQLVNVPAGADMPSNAGDWYQVSHSTRVFVVDAEGNYRGSFAPPFDAEILWQDLKLLME